MGPRKPARGRILIVEDEEYVRRSLAELLESRGYDVTAAGSAEEAFGRLARAPVDVVLSDLRLAGTDGLTLVRRLRDGYAELPVVILTGHGTIASAVDCIRSGATDYILKPADPDVLEVSLDRALATRAMKRELAHLRNREEALGESDRPVGESAVWHALMRQVRAAAPTDSTVLLRGESGTGKELLARLLHRLGPRAGRAFVRVNCSATPVEMWESEFFGHRRGSFTGATSDRDGRFLAAHRGTLFMDEIGTMPLAAQAKILRVLEDGEFQRLGDEQPTRVDVRIIAATNSDLEAELEAGRFRQDLFYRLNVLPIRVPPLRERLDDLPLLVERLVAEIAARLNRPVPRIAAHALDELAAYSWPGNVRELRNVLERALILNPDELVTALELGPLEAGGATEVHDRSDLNLRRRLAVAERNLVVDALRRAGGVRKEAARLLGIDQRNLPYYLRKHEIEPDTQSGHDD
ncbi:MAG TPA: sigma-54 dependent transcriptional regulator [Candidatus Polarisedimenticolaceae bacterium]|nr:sigma-54 dependent transcriptional regulator [Candidatus Polarisedimenticolaceae bacterium]